MYPAMCFDTGMLVGLLLFVLIVGAAVSALFVSAVVTTLKWVNARQKRLAAES
jgi:hypothetical protein